MTRRSLVVGLAAAAVALAVLAGCGISTEPQADRIDPDAVPFGLLEAGTTSTTTAEAGRATTVYLRSRDRLVAVPRTVDDEASLADLLELVVAGPSESERSLGITSALPAGSVAAVEEGRGVATVDLAAAFGDIRTEDQLVALAQIVYTLTGQPGIGAVDFTLAGVPIRIPLADGTISTGALSRDDLPALAPA